MMDEEEREALKRRIDARTRPGWDGLSVGPGWYEIVDTLDREIADIVPDYEVHQIKEKFGGLRYYYGVPGGMYDAAKTEALAKVEARAEAKALVTCERCGEPGVIRSGGLGWIRVLCDEHAEGR